MPARYAIYYAPAADSDLWVRATQWIGADAASGLKIAHPAEIGFQADQLEAATFSPRRYGFHATLKPPMHLRQGYDYAALVKQVSVFCSKTKPVRIGFLKPDLLDGFLALVPVDQSAELVDFAARCVTTFDGLRAPMDAATRAKRVAAGLTSRQLTLLDTYGYPYVLELFRMHMTLTDRLDAPTQDAMLSAAQTWFEPALAAPFAIDTLSIYAQDAPGAPFRRVADFPLLGS